MNERLEQVKKILKERFSDTPFCPYSEPTAIELARQICQLFEQPEGGSRMKDVPEQEYGKDHPWTRFDTWHLIEHEVYQTSWPCLVPLRCLWRYTRKTDAKLTQNGEEWLDRVGIREQALKEVGKWLEKNKQQIEGRMP